MVAPSSCLAVVPTEVQVSTQTVEQIAYARIITPDTTFYAWGIVFVGESPHATVTARVRPERQLTDATIEEVHGVRRISGTNPEGTREVWSVLKLSCGCRRSVYPTAAQDVPT